MPLLPESLAHDIRTKHQNTWKAQRKDCRQT